MSTGPKLPGPGQTQATPITPSRTPATAYKAVKTDEYVFERREARVRIVQFKIGMFDGCLIRFERVEREAVSPELCNQLARVVSGYRLVVVETEDPELATMLVTSLIPVTTAVAVKRPGENSARIVFSVFNFPAGSKVELDF